MQKLVLLGVLLLSALFAGSFAAPLAVGGENAALQQETLRELGSEIADTFYNYLKYKLQPSGGKMEDDVALIEQETLRELGSEFLESLHRYLQNKLSPYLQLMARQQAAIESSNNDEQLSRALNRFRSRVLAPGTTTEEKEVAREQFWSIALPILGSVASDFISDAIRRG